MFVSEDELLLRFFFPGKELQMAWEEREERDPQTPPSPNFWSHERRLRQTSDILVVALTQTSSD